MNVTWGRAVRCVLTPLVTLALIVALLGLTAGPAAADPPPTVAPTSATTTTTTPVDLAPVLTGTGIVHTTTCIVDGLACTPTLVVPDEGTWSVNTTTGVVTFTAVAGFAGTTPARTYRVFDNLAQPGDGPLTVTVDPPAVPTVTAKVASTVGSTATVVTPTATPTAPATLANASTCVIDPADSVCKTTVTIAGQGTFVVNTSTRALTFTAVAGFTGAVTVVSYRVTDSYGQTGQNTVTLTVSLPGAPVVTAKVASATGSTATTVTPTVTPTTFLTHAATCVIDPVDSVCKQAVAIAGQGSFVVNTTTSALTFTAVAGFTGSVTLVTYQVTDSYGQIASNTVTVTVNLPAAPVVTAKTASPVGEAATTVTPTVTNTTFLVNASTCVIDPADSVCKQAVVIPGEGTFVVNTSTRALTFTAVTGFTGAVSVVTYRVVDTYGQQASNTVTVTVLAPAVPVVTPKVVSVSGATATAVTPTVAPTTFLVNASTCVIDPADSVCKQAVVIPGEGTFVVNTSTRALTFTAVTGFTGVVPDVTYRVTDSYGQSGSSTVSVTVVLPAAPSVAAKVVTTVGSTATTVTPTVTNTTFLVNASTCVVDPDDSVCKATVVISGKGTFVVNTSTRALTFTAETGFTGVVPDVTYRVTDSYGQSGSSTVSVTVDLPAVPAVTAASLAPAATVAASIIPTVAPTTFLVNASTCVVDPDDSVCKTTVVIAGKGTFVINTSTRRVTFTAVTGFTGAVPDVTYRVTDSYGQTGSNTVAVTVSLPAAPVVTAKVATVVGAATTTVTPAVTPTTYVVNADTCAVDPDDSVCKTTVVISGKGTFVVNTSTRALTFTPVTGFTGIVPDVTYRVIDIYGQHDANTVSVTVDLPAVPAVTAATLNPTATVAASIIPTAAPTTFLVNADTCVVDPDDSVCKTTVVIAGKGSFVINTSTRRVTFTAVAGFAGVVPDVTYRVIDSYGQSGSNTVSVTVNLPAAPVVAAKIASVTGTTALTATPTVTNTTYLVNASTCVVDPDDSVCKQAVVISGKGTFVVNTSTRALTFTAVTGFAGVVPDVTYRVVDTYGQSDSNTVSVTVDLPAVPVVTAVSLTPTATTAATVTPTVVPATYLVNASTCVVDPDDSVCKQAVVISGKGTFVVNTATRAVTFTAVAGFASGVPDVTYRVIDTYGQTGSNTISTTVNPPAAPVVTTKVASTIGTTVATVTPTVTNTTFLVNASTCVVDPDDSVCKTTVVISGKGTFVVNTSTRALTFTAVTGFTGVVPDVTYRVVDTYGQSDSNTVSVTVDLPAVPVVTAATLSPTGTVAASVTAAVVPTTFLVSASTCVVDPDDSVCKTTVVISGKGTFVVNTSTRAVTFTAVTGFAGAVPDVTYRVVDSYGQTGSNTIGTTVNTPTAPVVAAKVASTTGTTALTATPTVTNTTYLVNASTCVVDPNDSVCKTTVVISGKGTFVVNTSTRALTFTAVTGFAGLVPDVAYRVVDSYGQTDSNTVSVTVNLPAPPVVTAKVASTVGATATTVTPTVTNTTYVVSASTCVVDPDDSVCKQAVVIAGKGTFVVNTSTRALTFTAVTGFTGVVPDVTYRVVDSYGQAGSNTVSVTVDLPAVPVVTVATLNPTGTTAVAVTPTVVPTSFLVSASTCVVDPDDSVCKTTVVISGKGAFVVNTSTRAVTFTAATGFVGAVPDVTYRVVDYYGQTGSNTVSVTVTVPAAPVVTAKVATTVGPTATTVTPTVTNTTYLVSASTCVVDPGDLVCKTTVTIAGKGSFGVNTSTRALTFTAVTGFTGAVPAVTYRVVDTYGQADGNTVSVTVAAPPAPIVAAKVATVVGAAATTVTPTVTNTTYLVSASTCVVDPADSVCKTTVTIAGKGSFVVNTSTRALTFTAVTGFTGAVLAVTYRVADNYAQSDSNTVTVTVDLPVAPVVTARVATVVGATATTVTPTVTNTTYVVNASTCIVDPADSVCKTTVVISGKGTFSVNTTTGVLTFTAVTGFSGGVPALTYRVIDAYGQSDSNTVTVTVDLPAAPVVTAATLSPTGTTAVSVTPTVAPTTFLVNASTCVIDPADSVCRTTVVIAGKGSFVVNTTNRALTFTAATGFAGVVPDLTYRVTDSYGQQGSNTVSVTVSVPAAPVVTAKVTTIVGSTASTVTPTVTNTTYLVSASTCIVDPDDSVCRTTVTIAGKGSFVVNTATRALTFTAVNGFTGVVPAVTYRVIDTYGQSDSNTVTLTVDLPPVPVVTPATIAPSGTTTTTVTPAVVPTTFLVNASTCVIDPDDSVCKTTVTITGKGFFVVNTATRSLAFTAVTGFTGVVPDLTYRVTDSYGQHGSSTVSVSVTLPVAPIVSAKVASVVGATATTVTPSVANTTYLVSASTCVVDPADSVCKTTVAIAGKGSFVVNPTTRALTFTAVTAFTGVVPNVTYRVIDSYGQSDSNTVSVTVDLPAVPVVTAKVATAVGANATTVTPTIAPTTFVVNASTCVVDPADFVCKTSVTIAGKGSFVVNTATGALTFTAATGFTGVVPDVTYRVTDSYGQQGSNTVSITVSTPAAPVVAAKVISVVGATATAVTPTVTNTTFVVNASTCVIDPADSVCRTTVTIAGKGSFVANTTTRALTFTAVNDFTGVVPDVTYRVTDTYGQEASNTVSVTVDLPAVPVVTAKVATAVGATATTVTPTVAPTTFLVDASTCVVDPADSLCKQAVTIAGNGTFGVTTSTGALTFTAATGFTGVVPDVTYRVTDTYGQQGSNTVTITVSTPPAPIVTAKVSTAIGATATTVTPTVTNTTFLVSASTCVVDPADSLCKTTVAIAGKGSFLVNTTTRALTFTAVTGFTGVVPAVTYRVTDTYGQSDSNTVTVTVDLPAVPVVTAATLTATGATATSVTPTAAPTTFLVNASTCVVDPADSLCKTTVAIPGDGTFVVNTATRAVTFTAATGFTGAVPAVTYRVVDTYGQTGSSTVTATVTTPAAPVVTAKVISVVGATATAVTPTVTNTTFVVNASTCVIDPADSVCRTTVTIAGKGSFVVNTTTRALTFTAATGFTGAVPAVTYRVTDTYGQDGSSTVSVTVDLPAVPVVTAATLTATATTAASITPAAAPATFLVNASTCVIDPADSVCKTTVVIAGKGSLVVNTTNRAVTFTAISAFSGAVPALTYRVTDSYGQTGSNSVTVTVNRPAAPVVTARVVSAAGAAPTVVTPTVTNTGFLVNASTCVVDPADSLCKTTVMIAGKGTFVVNTATRALTFTAATGFTGVLPDVSYQVTDLYGQSAANTVTVTVTLPVTPTVTAATLSATAITAVSVTPTATPTTFLVNADTCVLDPSDSVCKTTVTIAGKGTFVVNTATRALTFTGVLGFTGVVPSVTYRVNDTYGQTGSNSVGVTVNAPAAPVVTAANVTTPYDTPRTLTPTATGTGIVNSSTCAIDPADSVCKATVVISGQGSWTVDTSTRALTFAPLSTFSGPATSVTYRVTDSYAQSSIGTSNVTVTVATPTAPVVTASSTATAFGTPTTVTPAVTGSNIVNASACLIDPADSVCKTSVSIAGQGDWSVDTSTRAVTYAPSSTFTGPTTAVVYRIADSVGQTGSNTVTVTVSNPATPAVTATLATTLYNTAVTVTPAATGTDLVNALTCVVSGSTCVTSLAVAGQGTWSVNATTRALTFTPLSVFAGTTAVTYLVADAYGQTGANTVTIDVAMPTPPRVSSWSGSTAHQTSISMTPIATGTGIDDAQTCLLSGGACVTSLTVPGEGSWNVSTTSRALTFAPAAGFAGIATAVVYRVVDAFGQWGENTVTVKVEAPVVSRPAEVILAQLPPVGGATVLLGGNPIAVTVTENRLTGTVEVSGGNFALVIDPRTPGGFGKPLDSAGRLVVDVGGDMATSGRGFLPDSPVAVYLLTGDRAISLGTLRVFSDGTFAGSVPIPGDLEPGIYTLQVNGLMQSTRLREISTQVLSISFRVTVAEPPAEVKAVRTLVYFDVLSARLSRAAKRQLDQVVRRLPRDSRNSVRIVGFVGPSATGGNYKILSRARAQAVEHYLRSKGVQGSYVVRAGGLASQPGPSARRASVLIVPSPAR